MMLIVIMKSDEIKEPEEDEDDEEEVETSRKGENHKIEKILTELKKLKCY